MRGTICLVHFSLTLKLQSCQNPAIREPCSLHELHSLVHQACSPTALSQRLSPYQPNREQIAEVSVVGCVETGRTELERP